MKFKEYIVRQEQVGWSIKDFLRSWADVSARELQKITRAKDGLKLNGHKTFLGQELKLHDRLAVLIIRERVNIVPESGVAIEVLYENEDLLVVNKPANMLVHPAGRTLSGTLLNYLAGQYITNRNVTLYALHRLDKDTTGCVLLAKNVISYKKLATQLQQGAIKRIYHAIVQGEPQEKATIDLPIGQDKKNNDLRIIDENGQRAITQYRILKRISEKLYLLELQLKTGRTHQIRLHLKHVKLPILGDRAYGIRSVLIRRQALHATTITFRNTIDEKLMEVRAPYMPDMNLLFAKE